MQSATMAILMLVVLASSGALAQVGVRPSGKAPFGGYAEIRGVQAGPFAPDIWQRGSLNILDDIRRPTIAPRLGKARNIYAPSVVQTDDGWRVFYGAWDGIPTGNDRIYSAFTRDFLHFTDKHTVIHNGDFIHVCNVSAVQLPDGSFSLMCTAYPDDDGLNKPAFFSSPDGKTWNGAAAPYVARKSDIIDIAGYQGYNAGDLNGMNALLWEDGVYRLYFGNFKDFGSVYRASSTDGKSFSFDGVSLPAAMAVNDVKRFVTNGIHTYMMGLHWNGDTLWYALSEDGMEFHTQQVLGKNSGPEDRYIVAIGWVVDGAQEAPGRRVLGYLYGAGAHSGLAQNRIFARWLQKKVVFEAEEGSRIEGGFAYGPDRQLLAIPAGGSIRGRLAVYAEDGSTLIGRSPVVDLRAGQSIELTIAPTDG